MSLKFHTGKSDERPIQEFLRERVFNGIDFNWRQYYASAGGVEILLFLDGFNEIALTGQKSDAIANEIRELLESLKCKIIITSRYENMLASRIKFEKKAEILPLSDDDLKGYFQQSTDKLSLKSRSPLFVLLKNPLMLYLYGQTSYPENYTDADYKLCRWIEFNKKDDIKISYILWNYLSREILKNEGDSEDKLLAWFTIHVFWPRIAFYIQSNNRLV